MPYRPSIFKTDAIVLRTLNYGETSRIVTLFTAERGKMSVMAKGARSTKSRFGSTLDPLGYIQAVIYYRPTRDLQSITEASHVRAFPVIRESLARIKVGLGAIELSNALMQEGEPNQEVFSLLVDILSRLNAPDSKSDNILGFFRLKMASLLGYSPSFEKELVEALDERGGCLDLETGAIYPQHSKTTGGIEASRSALRAYSIVARASLPKVMQMALRPETAREVEDLITAYMRYHFEEAYPERSSTVFAKLEAY